ncbi:hypothetical protein [Streptomyces sp. NPDC013181]|uniref:hypothetical protein n=1 Tax=Streptomyces sp. NPDC013181 TaxID=3364864 RepID=UPI0036844E7C
MTHTVTTDEGLRAFVKFSAEVTGFSEFDLWGTGQAETYYRTVLEQEGPGALQTAASSGSAAPADPVVNSIIKLWYVGVWYGPELTGRVDVAAWTAPGRSGTKPAVPDSSRPDDGGQPAGSDGGLPAGRDGADRIPLFVVSPDAYTEGLLWRAIGAHPSGAKAPGYGSWALPPTLENH